MTSYTQPLQLNTDVFHSDQQVVQLPDEAKVAPSGFQSALIKLGDSDSHMVSPEPNCFPTFFSTSSASSPSYLHLFLSQEIQEGGWEGNLLRHTRKHTLAGEGKVSTGLLSRGG